jgi:cell division protein FtsN
MKKIFCTILVIFFSLVFVSCAAKKDQQTQIRIVDLQGKSRAVHTQVPELNLQAMYMQGMSTQASGPSNNSAQAKNSAEIPQQNLTQNNNDFGKTIQQVFQPISQKQNQQVAANNNVVTTAGAVQNPDQTVQYDLSESDQAPAMEEKLPAKKSAKKILTSKKSSKKTVAAASATKGIFVQVGSFSVLYNAKQSLASMQKFHSGIVETVEGEKPIYRVLLGPFSNKKAANQMVAKITNSGREAIVVRNR